MADPKPAVEPSTGPPASRSVRRGRAWRLAAIRGLVLAALLGLTFWNVTRSAALAEAKAADTKGDHAVCLEKALEYLDHVPWSREAALLAARSLSRLDYADEAEPYYRHVGALSPEDMHARAYAHVRAGHLDRAIALYEEILARRPDDVVALRRLAAVQLTRNDGDALMALSKRLIAIPKGAPIGFTLLGVVQHNSENREAAAAAFERVLDLDPELASMPLPRRLFWDHLANDLLAVGRIEDACRYLGRAVEEIPDPSLLDFLGHAYERGGHLDRAEACWLRALEQDPRMFRPVLNLGKLAQRRKEYPRAIEYLRRAEELAPRDYETAYQLALTYRLMGRDAEAARYRKKAEELRARSLPVGPTGPPKPLPGYAL